MSQQLEMLCRSEFVIERNQYSTAIKNRIRRNQPLRLVRHDDRSAISRIEIRILEGARQWQCNLFEIRVGEPDLFAIAIRLDQAYFSGEAVECITQRRAQTGILPLIKHLRSGRPLIVDGGILNCT